MFFAAEDARVDGQDPSSEYSANMQLGLKPLENKLSNKKQKNKRVEWAKSYRSLVDSPIDVRAVSKITGDDGAKIAEFVGEGYE